MSYKLLKNGKILTPDGFCTALLIKDKTIVFTGSDEETMAVARSEAGTESLVLQTDLSGKLVMPGLIDSHAHGGGFGAMALGKLELSECETKEECVSAIKNYAKKNPDLSFLKGYGWSSPLFGELGPDKMILDDICPDIPCAIQSAEGHAWWVNSKMLQNAGVNQETPNPRGGKIFRDIAGNPSGCLADEAAELIQPFVPDDPVEVYKNAILLYQEEMLPLGITSTGELLVRKNSNLHKAYRELAEKNDLKIKTVLHFTVKPSTVLEDIKELHHREYRENNKLIEGSFVKFFLDGVLENHTCALKEDYANDPGFKGELLWDTHVLKKAMADIDSFGYNIHVHCIGDAAVSQALDAFAYLLDLNGEREDRKLVLAHVQLLDATDLARMETMNVMVSANPYWFFKDPIYTKENELPELGEERMERQYPMRSLFDRGIIVSSGSDYPITLCPYPVLAVKCGMQRVGYDCPGTDEESLLGPSERCTLDQMIRSITINGAMTLGIDNGPDGGTGVLSPGKLADIIVLDQDIFAISADDYNAVKVEKVYSEGELLFS